jgi:hypothetical protein
MSIAKTIIDAVTHHDRISAYLAQCRVVSETEGAETHVPPSKGEVISLIRFLRDQKTRPLVIGGVGVLNYLKGVDPQRGFRPTSDLDLWVDKVPVELPKGWTKDPEAVGVHSWVSPSGGYVDFLTPGHQFPGGEKLTVKVDPDPVTVYTKFPIASWLSILKLKLCSVREKDLADCIALVRAMGKVPGPDELGKLNATQRDNLDLVNQWFKLRPVGNYGE